MYNEKLEEIINHFSEHHATELTQAREDFFDQTGEVFEEDPFYEERLTNYLEYFLFDRSFNGESSAMVFYRDSVAKNLDGQDMETLEAFCHPIHSVFSVKRLIPKKHIMVLEDLADKARYEVTERRSLVALSKGDIFEARLIQKAGITFLMDAFVHHPPEARSYILKKTKQMRKKGDENFLTFMMTLQKLWMQCQRYSHLGAVKIYSDEYIEKIHAG